MNDKDRTLEKPKTYKHRILDFLETVGAEGADNAQIRSATSIPSHQQVYLLTQELASRGVIRAGRKGSTWRFFPLDTPAPLLFEGIWKVVSSPDFDRNYLEMEAGPYIRVRVDQFRFSGDFHIGLIQGDFAGRLDGKRVLFSFEASDEMDLVHGAGTMALLEKKMELRLLFYHSDEYTFICERG